LKSGEIQSHLLALDPAHTLTQGTAVNDPKIHFGRGLGLGCYMSEIIMKTSVPAGTENARPFLPTKDFDLSKQFYETLGFTKLLDGEVAIFRIGASSFVLQKYYQKQWAENFMMQLMVDSYFSTRST